MKLKLFFMQITNPQNAQKFIHKIHTHSHTFTHKKNCTKEQFPANFTYDLMFHAIEKDVW